VTEGIEVRLASPVGEIWGEVLDARSGAPIVQALVMAASENSLQVALTEEDGSFALIDLPQGSYVVAAVAEGYEELEQDAVEIRAGGTTPSLTFGLQALPSPD